MASTSAIQVNRAASNYTYEPSSSSTATSVIRSFHHTLPNFSRTPLIPLDHLAGALNVRAVFVKLESSRASLPAFKILGASWGTFRAVCEHTSMPLTSTLSEVGAAARKAGIVLFAATEGNHGRAVARMGKILDVKVKIFVPDHMYMGTREKIASEGAEIVVVNGDYDAAVAAAWKASLSIEEEKGILVQDNSFDEYERIPAWIVEGYSTLLEEAQEQVVEAGFVNGMTHVVTPIGVGSLGHAVVAFAKGRTNKIGVVAVEPDSAACLYWSLKNGKHTVIEARETVMSGMCCATVSPISWPILKDGVDVSTTVSDIECHETVLKMEKEFHVSAGPCGAGALRGFLNVVGDPSTQSMFDTESVIVLLCTEGPRDYPIPRGSES